MANLVLKGHISYATKRRYKWIAEFGKNTCKKCAALNGQIFDEEDVPYWPHPNCRCKVEEISIVDTLESEYNEYKEEIEQLKLQAEELLGDSNVLEEQIEKLLNEHKSKELNELERKATHLKYEAYKIIDKIEALTVYTISKRVVEEIEKEIAILNKTISNYFKEYKDLDENLKIKKATIDSLVFATILFNAPMQDAAALWVLSSSKFTRGLEYLENNGKIINKVSDLKNEKLEKIVKDKLKSQIKRTESRGVQLHSNSSLSKSIANSSKFKQIIQNKKDELMKPNNVIYKVSTFLEDSLNNHLAIHGCDILNIRIENGILYATILDTVDYNFGDKLVTWPRDLQEAVAIENYYILIEIAEPISKYFKM